MQHVNVRCIIGIRIIYDIIQQKFTFATLKIEYQKLFFC